MAVIAATAPDILLLTEFDYDAGGAALSALAQRLRARGVDYPHQFALRPNTGLPTGLDLDGNGRFGEGADVQGFGHFPGDGGMAILSRWPIGAGGRDLSGLLWGDLPQGNAHRVLSADQAAVQRLSTTGHWVVPVETPAGRLTLLAFAATAPVFDGPEDRNGWRNVDEIALWQRLLDGAFGPAPEGAFVVLGRVNLDPVDGEGRHQAIRALLADPRLQDPAPTSVGGRLAPDPGHRGAGALDTADWPDGAPGNLRVSYVLPAAQLTLRDSGVVWPPPDAPLAEAARQAGPHRMVWVDIELP